MIRTIQKDGSILDLEENKNYEDIIKKVIEKCFKEEKLEDSEKRSASKFV